MSRHSESATSSRGLTGLRQLRLVILSPPLITVRINRAREPFAPWALIAFAYCDILAQHRLGLRLRMQADQHGAGSRGGGGFFRGGRRRRQLRQLKDATTAYLSNIPDGDAKSEGMRLGEVVAAKILEARAKDGADAADAYRPKTKPGVYVPTPITVASMWPNVKRFAMTSPSQFRPEPPIALTSEQWANDYNEIKELGGRTSSKRTAKQTEDARFWLITGPQATDPVARQLVAVKGMDLVDSARFIALAAVALADAYIAVMDAKYHYEFWRPVTAIRNGDTDDNPATERDATWQPIDNTPMHPEYPCAH